MNAYTQHTVSSDDGAALAVRWFDAAAPEQGTVVIGAAMGVPQVYYGDFAAWLAQQGWRVVTFDYRGYGESRPGTRHGGLRGFRTNLFDWARDYEAVLEWARERQPHGPLYLLGHSLGGQLPGMVRNRHLIDGMVGVAAGSGYWRHNAPPTRRVAPLLWYLMVPLATPLFGYFPGKRLGAVGDLPAGVIRQWRRWCLNPHYSVGAEGAAVRASYDAVRFPVLSVALADDEMLSTESMRGLLGLYRHAPRKLVVLAPQQVGVRRIGHLGLFKREHAQGGWPRLHQFLCHLTREVAA